MSDRGQREKKDAICYTGLKRRELAGERRGGWGDGGGEDLGSLGYSCPLAAEGTNRSKAESGRAKCTREKRMMKDETETEKWEEWESGEPNNVALGIVVLQKRLCSDSR